jgi:hypothetical protein
MSSENSSNLRLFCSIFFIVSDGLSFSFEVEDKGDEVGEDDGGEGRREGRGGEVEEVGEEVNEDEDKEEEEIEDVEEEDEGEVEREDTGSV